MRTECHFKDLPLKILDLAEIRQVLEDLEVRRNHRSRHWAINSWMNLIIFRLSTCCGLRCKEIRYLRLDDFLLEGSRPVVRVRKEATKGQIDKRRSRLVPLWWDRGTYNDIAEFVTWRRATMPATATLIRADWNTKPNECARVMIMPRKKVWKRYKTAIRCLGPERASQISIHCGRHTFCSHALRNGRSLMEVRDAAGHAFVTTTQIYLHALDSGKLPDIFPEDAE